jgi:serine/threonine protein phosphatase PrpC
MQPGSRLVIFTDGLTDAQNAAEEEFGDERLIDCCRRVPAGFDANGVADRVMQAVAEWSGGTEQFDDTTVVVIDWQIAPDNGPHRTAARATESQSRHHWQHVVTADDRHHATSHFHVETASAI